MLPAIPREEKEQQGALLDSKSNIIIRWKQERGVRGNPVATPAPSFPSPSPTQEDPRCPRSANELPGALLGGLIGSGCYLSRTKPSILS